MIVRTLAMKNDSGTLCALLPVTFGEEIRLRLPGGTTVEIALVDNRLFFSPDARLPIGGSNFSMIGRFHGERVFAGTQTGEEAAFAKWRMLCALKEREKPKAVPTSPLPQEAKEDMAKAPEETGAAQVEMPAPSLPDADRQEELSKRFDIRELSEEMRPDPIARANALLKEGKPFTLFQDLMPGSRWAMIEKEEFHYLIGVTEEERPRLLYGIPGTLSCPPDEGTLWTFFPTEEGGEQGYYLTERKELDR